MTQTQTDYPQRVIVSNDEELRAVTELLQVLRGMDRAELLRTAWQITLKRSGSSVRSTIAFDGAVLAAQG
jgi:hypothetical protein